MTEGNGNITYTTKEVLARIEGKLDMLSLQVQQKADLAAVTSIQGRISAVETQQRADVAERAAYREYGDLLIKDFEAAKNDIRFLKKMVYAATGALTVIGFALGFVADIVVKKL